jgi:hypothetical protein
VTERPRAIAPNLARRVPITHSHTCAAAGGGTAARRKGQIGVRAQARVRIRRESGGLAAAEGPGGRSSDREGQAPATRQRGKRPDTAVPVALPWT